MDEQARMEFLRNFLDFKQANIDAFLYVKTELEEGRLALLHNVTIIGAIALAIFIFTIIREGLINGEFPDLVKIILVITGIVCLVCSTIFVGEYYQTPTDLTVIRVLLK